MCQTREHRRHHPEASGCCCCGCGCGHSFRRFFSSQEERERLENYRDQLKKELAAVEERLGAV
jgi:hypothetical protein